MQVHEVLTELYRMDASMSSTVLYCTLTLVGKGKAGNNASKAKAKTDGWMDGCASCHVMSWPSLAHLSKPVRYRRLMMMMMWIYNTIYAAGIHACILGRPSRPSVQHDYYYNTVTTTTTTTTTTITLL